MSKQQGGGHAQWSKVQPVVKPPAAGAGKSDAFLQRRQDKKYKPARRPTEEPVNLFDIFNEKERKKEQLVAKKAAERKRIKEAKVNNDFSTGFDGPVSAQGKAMAKRSSKKKSLEEEAAPPPKRPVKDACMEIDAEELAMALTMIDAKFGNGGQEHVQVLKLAEFFEEELKDAEYNWGVQLQSPLLKAAKGDPSALYRLLPEAAVLAPASYLPKRVTEPVLKWLRQRSPETLTGLVAFLLAQIFKTLGGPQSASGAAGVGVRVVLQLVARHNPGCVAMNLEALPVFEGLDPSNKPAKPTWPYTEASPQRSPHTGHPLCEATCAWVLRQLPPHTRSAQGTVLRAWWEHVLPVLANTTGKQAHLPAARWLALRLSTDWFQHAKIERWEPRPAEREAGEGAAGWMPTPVRLRALLQLGATQGAPPSDRSDRSRAAGAAEWEKAVRSTRDTICQVVLRLRGVVRGEKAQPSMGPAMFSQLLPVAALDPQRDADASQLACGLLQACLETASRTGASSKTWQNWLTMHQSGKASSVNGSVALLRYLCTKGSTQQISAVQLASTSAAMSAWHGERLEGGGAGGKKDAWTPALLEEATRLCAAVMVGRPAGGSASACGRLFVFLSLAMVGAAGAIALNPAYGVALREVVARTTGVTLPQ